MGKADMGPRRGSRRPSEDDSPVRDDRDEDVFRSSDWGSLIGDLSRRGEDPTWQVHDRTHLEFAVDYPVTTEEAEANFEWEAFFFIPRSLRINPSTYRKSDVFSDLQSYIRFAVPLVPFESLSNGACVRLESVLDNEPNEEAALRAARLFACQVRASGVGTRNVIVEELAPSQVTALSQASSFIESASKLRKRLAAIIAKARPGRSAQFMSALRWIDEDISRVVETIVGELYRDLSKVGAPKSIVQSAQQVSVDEARYRREVGLGGVLRKDSPSKRDVEHMEFRRHLLNRYTSSVLWLRAQAQKPGAWTQELLYSIAAGVAMAFAIAAALWNGFQASDDKLWLWGLVAVLAYMAKDRIKATLQRRFNKLVSKQFPDRRWHINDPERHRFLGRFDDYSEFVSFGNLPEEVLACRRSTGRGELEELAAPESVLHHRKVVRLKSQPFHDKDDFDALTEIFRLDLSVWLQHTDDPKREILYAHAESGEVRTATAPRVYNIGVVYRLKKHGDGSSRWKRVRVVVSRKGIKRVEHVSEQ